MADLLEIALLCLFISASLFRWTCTDIKGSENWDRSMMPSLLGPGSYLGWIITGIDAFWKHWTEIMPWRVSSNNRLPEIEDDANDNQREAEREGPVLQTIAFGAYAAVALGYLGVMVVQKMPSFEYAAHADAFYLMSNTVFVVAYPFVEKVFPSGVRAQGYRRFFNAAISPQLFAGTLLQADFSNLNSFPKRLEAIVRLGILTTGFFVLIALNMRRQTWSIGMEWATSIPTFTAILVKRMFANTKEDDKCCAKWDGVYRLRMPMPKTMNRLAEIDQAFALGLAIVSFLFSRREIIVWLCKEIALKSRKVTVRVQRYFTEREI